MIGKITPFKACASNNTSSGSNPSAEVKIPINITIANTKRYFLLLTPPFQRKQLLIVAAAPIGEAIAEDSPAENSPILINNGAKSPRIGLRGSDS